MCDCNAELQDESGDFIGDRANKRAFRSVLQAWRDRLPDTHDPLGDTPAENISKKTLDKILVKGEPVGAGVILGVVEEFARELAAVVRRLLRTAGWRGVERIAVGGGLRASRVGELVIGRASVLLKADGHAVELRPIRHHPNEAGLVGAIHLLPSPLIADHDALLAVDIGGTNIRVGLVEMNLGKAPDGCAARVMGLDVWRHGDQTPDREEAIGHLVKMTTDLIRRARKDKIRLAPLISIACPGLIAANGQIQRGGQNLPGNWEAADFNLPSCLSQALPEICDQPAEGWMHNDAVIQGLSERPWMSDVQRWGVLTIGTGLGNASFLNRTHLTRLSEDK